MLQIRHGATHDIMLEVEGDSLEGQNLANAHLDGAKLACLSLQYACLRNAQLRRANLSGSMLKSAMIDGADLEDAVLAGCDLSLATLLGASLKNVDLTQAILRYAKLTGADLQFANLQGADLSMSDARANFHQANLSGCDLRGANLSGANLQMADLTDADLTSANIEGTVFLGAKLTGAKMPAHATARNLVALTTQRPRAAEEKPVQRRPDADWRSVAKPDFDQPPVTCPECGLKAQRGAALADGSFRCRGCYAVFSPDAAGQRQSDAFRVQRDAEFMDKLAGRTVDEKAFRWGSQAAVMLVAALSLLLMIYLAMRYFNSLQVPANLRDRAIYVADAFVHDAPGRIAAVSPSGSDEMISTWLKRRPSRLDELGAVDYKVVQQVELNISQALVMVQIAPPGRGQSTESADALTLSIMFFRKNPESTWLLDLTSTLARTPVK